MLEAPTIVVENDGTEVGFSARIAFTEMRHDSNAVEKAVAIGVNAVREKLAERVLRMALDDHWEISIQSNTQEDRACRMVECKVIGWLDPIRKDS